MIYYIIYWFTLSIQINFDDYEFFIENPLLQNKSSAFLFCYCISFNLYNCAKCSHVISSGIFGLM